MAISRFLCYVNDRVNNTDRFCFASAGGNGAIMEKTWRTVRTVPVLLALAFVPLIVTAKKYNIGLNGYKWYSDSVTSTDLFLYWKGQILILLAFLMMACLLVSLAKKEWMPDWRRFRTPELLWLGSYLVLAVISSLCSEYRAFSLWGSYEQWEGMFILLAYGILMLYVYLMVDTEWLIRLVVYGIVAGGFLMGLLGTFQFLGMDLFRGRVGQVIMNLLIRPKMNYTFNFSEGWVYASLYNPNYVGSYAALLLPVLVTVAMMEWRKLSRFWTVTAMAGSCLMTVTLLGSQSLTGCVGVITSVVFLVIYQWRRIVTCLGWKKLGASAAALGVFAAVAVTVFPAQFQAGTDKLFHPKEDTHMIRQMVSSAQGLNVITAGDRSFTVVLTGQEEEPLKVQDTEGREQELLFHEGGNYYTIKDHSYDYKKNGTVIAEPRLYKTVVTKDDIVYEAVRIVDHQFVYEKDKAWTIARVGEEYQIYNAFRKLDRLQDIPAVGFAGNQHFGDKRGYIWSRTLPLLKDYILTGSGPSTFTLVFPNHDYVGKMNMNYDGVTVTKPHNMYLQIWTQTGLLSLIAFLLLFGWYFVKSVRLYWNSPLETVPQKIGVAVMVALFGYMVTGIANDSTVAVAPVFWGMLGFGMAVNRLVAARAQKKDRAIA